MELTPAANLLGSFLVSISIHSVYDANCLTKVVTIPGFEYEAMMKEAYLLSSIENVGEFEGKAPLLFYHIGILSNYPSITSLELVEIDFILYFPVTGFPSYVTGFELMD